MESFKFHSSFFYEFNRPPAPISSVFSYDFIHPSFNIKLNSTKSPFSLAATLHYYFKNTRISAKVNPDDTYIYKIMKNYESIPLVFLAKLHFQGEKSIKNCMSVEYKHRLVNLNIKIRDHPMNLLIASTVGHDYVGLHSKIKTNPRLNKMLKCIFGGFYTSPSLHGTFKYNFNTKESTLYIQKKIDEKLSLGNSITFNKNNSALNVQTGLFGEINDQTSGKIKFNTKGQVLFSLLKKFDENLQIETGGIIDIGKSSSKSLSYSSGLKVSLNFNSNNSS